MARKKTGRRCHHCGHSYHAASSCERGRFDPGIADQVTLQALTAALHNMQTNATMDRNLVGNSASALSQGVQLINASTLKSLTQLSPLEAAAAANVATAQMPSFAAALRTAAHIPTADQTKPPIT